MSRVAPPAAGAAVLWRGRLVELVPLELVPLAALYDAAVATGVGIGWRPPALRSLADLVASLPTGASDPGGGSGASVATERAVPSFGPLPRGTTTAFAVGDARRAHLVGFVGLGHALGTGPADLVAGEASLVAFFDLRHERTAALAADALVAMCRYAFAIVGVAGLRLAVPPTIAGGLRSAIERLDGLVHLGVVGGDDLYRVPAPAGPVAPPTPRAVPALPTGAPPGPGPARHPLPRAGLPVSAPPWPSWPARVAATLAAPRVVAPGRAPDGPDASPRRPTTQALVVDAIRAARGPGPIGPDDDLVDDLGLDAIALVEVVDVLARRTGRALSLDAVLAGERPVRVVDLAAMVEAAPRRRPWPGRAGPPSPALGAPPLPSQPTTQTGEP